MSVYLIGAGVVGREILKAHLRAGIPVCIADQNEVHLRESIDQLGISGDRTKQTKLGRLAALEIDGATNATTSPTIVIESISERVEIKQSFFQMAERLFDDKAIFCSNTSTLRISHIACKLKHPHRFGGMHFFMPVEFRDAVEVVRGEQTDPETIEVCSAHVRSLQKNPLVVADGPGFIVNRLLCPYLNEALLLLGRGVSAQQLERAAIAYGMPMSPLELMDWIGSRTMFDAGRAFWQSFPSRFEPTPILPAMVKAQRLGRDWGCGCFDYTDGRRSEGLSAATKAIVDRYQRGEDLALSDQDVMLLLAIPMWIEAAMAFREGIAQPIEQFNLAMTGGLGYQSSGTWLQFFETLGSEDILNTIDRFAATTKSLRVPDDLIDTLTTNDPTAAIQAFARRKLVAV